MYRLSLTYQISKEGAVISKLSGEKNLSANTQPVIN